MNQENREHLESLLRDLCSAQDTVTHNNESGPDYALCTQAAIADRDQIKQRILRFWDASIPKVQALIDAAQAVVDGAHKEITPADCTCGACTRRNRLADALRAFEVPT